MRHAFHPLAFVLGIFVIFIGLLVLRAAVRNFGEGSCLTGCCMWELGESILDIGCGMLSCGSVLGLGVLGLIAAGAWLHR